MMRTTLAALILSSLSLVTTACTTQEPLTDDLAGDEDVSADGKADDAMLSGFYAARRLVQRCPGDECRGLGLSSLNKTATTCADGTREEDGCYIGDPSIDWTATGLDPEQVAELIGKLPYGLGSELEVPVVLRGDLRDGQFAVTEVWLSPEPRQAEGVFVVVKEEACSEAPCPLVERKLNSTLTAELTGLDLEAAAPEPLVRALLDSVLRDAESPGLLVVGERTQRDGGKSRSIEQYWMRVAGGE